MNYRYVREHSRLALIMLLCCDLGCRTTGVNQRRPTTENTSSPKHVAEGTQDTPLSSKQVKDLEKIAGGVQSAYKDFLRDPESKELPDMQMIARAIASMSPEALTEMLASREDFTRLQHDMNRVDSVVSQRAATQGGNTYIEGEIPWEEFEKIEATSVNPYEKGYTAGKVLIGLGVGSIVAGYFVQFTNKQHKYYAEIEQLRKSNDAINTLVTERNAELVVRSKPQRATKPRSLVDGEIGFEDSVNQAESFNRSASEVQSEGNEGNLKSHLDEVEATTRAEGGWKSKERYQASKALKIGGVVAAIAGVGVLVGTSATETYYELTDSKPLGEKQERKPNTALGKLMAKLAQLEVAIQRVYRAAEASSKAQ